MSCLGLTEKVAVVTGASRGIGKAAALRFAQEGCRVVLSGRDASALAAVEREICSGGGQAISVCGDICQEDVPELLMRRAQAAFGTPEILVNSAGIAKLVPLLELDGDTWRAFLDLHLTATLRCALAAVRGMLNAKKGGCIINMASISASMSMYGTGAYAAAKAAVCSLTRTMAVEWAGHDIRVNAVAPGPVATERLRAVYDDTMYRERSRAIPLQRLAEPLEVAESILFLASAAARYITGETLTVDGGASAIGCYSYKTYKRQGAV